MLYYLKKHWKINLLTIILQIVYPVVSVLSSLALIQVTQGIFTMDMDYFVLWMGVDIVLWLCHVALLSASTWTRSRAIMLMKNSARADITATLLAKKYRDFHAQQTGEYLSWYTNDVSYMVSLGWNSVYSLTAVLSQVIFSILALAQMHWSLLVVSSVAAVVLAVFPKMFTKHLEKISETCSEKQAQAMSKMSDLLSGLDVLRSFGKTSLFIKGQQEASEQMERPQYKMNYSHGLAGQVINLVNVLCKLSVNVLIGFLSIQGTIIQSALLGGGDLCGKIYDGLAGISNYMMTIRSAKPYFARITVRANDDIRMGESGITPLKNGITVEHLGFGYGENPILIDTNMCFEKGGKYALTGPSGCGKSTLLKLLLGWLPEYTGKITFDGQNAKNFTSEQLQQQISYIEQDVFLFNTTIRDNITLGENYSEALIERAIKGSALDNDLANMPLGLDTPVGEDGNNLSGGQKQRVAIARALLHNRSILLVDEGTSALDQKNADIVEQSLLNNPDLTLILISHHLSEERKKQFTKVYEMEPVSYIASSKEVATV